MAKKDRYDFDGADDDLGSGETPSTNDTDDADDNEDEHSTTRSTTGPHSQTTDDTTTTSNGAHSAHDEIPHRVRHDSPKEDRKAKTIYFDNDDLATIRNLKNVAEDEFNQTIYDLDVYLAAFRSDLSELSFLEEMREIGYGYFE